MAVKKETAADAAGESVKARRTTRRKSSLTGLLPGNEPLEAEAAPSAEPEKPAEAAQPAEPEQPAEAAKPARTGRKTAAGTAAKPRTRRKAAETDDEEKPAKPRRTRRTKSEPALPLPGTESREPAAAEADAAAAADPAKDMPEAPAADAAAPAAEDAQAGAAVPAAQEEDGGEETASLSFSSLIQRINHSSAQTAQEPSRTREKPAAKRRKQPEPEPETEAAVGPEAQDAAPSSDGTAPADVPAGDGQEGLSDMERSVLANVDLEEQHAVAEGDPSSYCIHSQYGDGRVETGVIGSADIPARMVDSDPGNVPCFFRSCRRVMCADVEPTPLPSEGFWVPSHPAPHEHQRETAARDVTGPEATAESAAPAAVPAAEGHAAHRILVCWVGKVDISAAMRHDTINPGPIRMLLEHVPAFDHVLLLTTQGQGVLDTLRAWLMPCLPNQSLEIRRTQAVDLSDHVLVCQATVEAVEDLVSRFGLPADGAGLTMHLSPGSPVTHAVMLLLTTIRFRGITLMQTRLTGLGKAPDILTVSLTDLLSAPGFTPETVPDVPLKFSTRTVSYAQPETEDEAQQDMLRQPRGRAGRRGMLSSKARPVHSSDMLRRFRPERRKQEARSGRQGHAQGHAQEMRPMELDMPMAVQEDNSLRAPSGNIGRPGRVSPTALQPKEGDPPLISSALGAVYKKMERVATMLLPILLLGESGCGKSRLARYLHEWSGRTGKFISLDCAGLTDEMFACELFGRPGSAGVRPREGAFRRARSGTLFLENINLLTPTQQSLLLRVLAPVGETKVYLPARTPFPACTVRVRIIASADASLLSDIRAGKFRTDLYYRLAGVSTTLPSVRDYSYEERENLLRSFLIALQHRLGQFWNFSGDAWQTLLDEKWPGNLREVSRILQQICLLSDNGATITREDVLQQLRQGRFAATLQRNAEESHHGAVQPFLGSEYGISASALEPDPAGYGQEKDDDGEDENPYEDDGDYEDGGEREGDDGAGIFVLGSGQSIDRALEQFRDQKVLEAMERANGSRAEAAAMLGMSTGQLAYALQRMKNSSSED